MSVDAVQPILMAQVVKSLLATTANEDNPFAALLANALSDEAAKR